jgi:CrcB protein
VAVALPHDPSQWPWSTVAVNLSGSALLACLLGTLIERWPRARLPQPLFGAGLLGGFTTFSTFSVDGFQLARHGRPLLALLYVVVSVAGGGACATAGLALARAADRLSDHQRWHRRAQLHLSSPQASPGPPTPEAGP